MDERLVAVREEIDGGGVSPRSLVLLFNTASDAGNAGDVETLEQTLELARAVAGREDASFRGDAERLVAICEQTMAAVGARAGPSGAPEAAHDVTACPDCGNEVAVSAVRCRRCGHLFL
jgi:predicted RNA-binding Zn-ribbon protein involved in translation (DUF1610 family)